MNVTTLRRRVRMWQRRSHLTDWTIAVSMVDSLKVRRKACHAATAVSSIADKRVDMEFDSETVNKVDAETLDHLICHELQHIVNHAEEETLDRYLGSYKSKVYRDWADANEKVCDHNAAIVVAAYRRKRDRPK